MKHVLGELLRRHVYGRRRFEPLFRSMHNYAIAGLFTVGDSFEGTGEAAVLDRLRPLLPPNPVIVKADARVRCEPYTTSLGSSSGRTTSHSVRLRKRRPRSRTNGTPGVRELDG